MEMLREIVQMERSSNHGRAHVPDHVHLLLSIPSKLSISGFMGHLNLNGIPKL